ncbi:hypothetical protein QR680_010875 [Steinernema hermaphroditum]|uniref:eIF-4F 25 kDa subunit n=1 Tax=Steinernema hermaphroditum TaxID=289476 RepID=A0AA39IRK4_9BILA|nr:hypothetical protein QR680_010875 [Steinernema hermaphroditum]
MSDDETIRSQEETTTTDDESVEEESIMSIRHPLKREWKLWYLNDNKNLNWLDRLKEVCTVKTLEEFWMLLDAVRKPSHLTNYCDYNFFRDGIEPVWEVDENKEGGRWVINIDRSKPNSVEVLDTIWEEVLAAVVGEQFGTDTEQITGVVLNVRHKGPKVCVWTKDVSNAEAYKRIGMKLKEMLIRVEHRVKGKPRLLEPLKYEPHSDGQPKAANHNHRRHALHVIPYM